MRTRTVIGGLFLLAALLVVARVLQIKREDVDWGDVPTWVAGAVAVVALLAAVSAGRTAKRLFDLEQKRENRAEKLEAARHAAAERAEQADHVACWITGDMVTVQNGSVLPIWAVMLRGFGPGGAHRVSMELPLVPPGIHTFEFTGESVAIHTSHEHSYSLGPNETYRPKDLSPGAEIEFRDAAGRTWKRSRQGVLAQTGVTVFGELAPLEMPRSRMDLHGTYTPPPPESM